MATYGAFLSRIYSPDSPLSPPLYRLGGVFAMQRACLGARGRLTDCGVLAGVHRHTNTHRRKHARTVSRFDPLSG